MRRPGTFSPDSQRLRRYLRDLAALTALPALWSEGDRARIAESLADVLVRVLHLDFLYVRLKGFREQSTIEVVRPDQEPDLPERDGAIHKALTAWLPGDTNAPTTLTLPHPLGEGSLQATVVPIGYGDDFGVLVAASRQPDFPTEEDRLLLGVVVNQAAVVLQRQQAEDALRQSEAQFRQLADALPQIVWTARPDGFIDYYNERWYEFTGFPRNAYGDQSWKPILHPDDVQRCVDTYYGCVRSGDLYQIEYRFKDRKTGGYRWFLGRAYPVRDAKGRIVHWFGTCTDIDDTKRAEEELKEADRRKDEFLATLAHELRNPLAPIRNALQLIRLAGTNPATLDQARGMMERQVKQMVRLVDDLLDVSRISRNKLELRREWVELAAVVQSAVETTRPLIEASCHGFSVTMPPEPILLDADPVRLAQVFANLLNNAAKYTDKGGHIWLSAAREGSTAVVRVRDTGIGIPAPMLPHIFEMFTQVDRSIERSQGGLGIGLTLVQRLTEMHGGCVEARSEGPGKGSEFVVRLPVVVVPPPPEPQPPGGADGRAVPQVRCRILIADDNRDSAASLSLMLNLLGHEVRTAHDGLEAVELATAFRPDVTLLDIGMPKLNGYDAARRLREQAWGKDILLIALTGWGQEEDRRRTREAGFNHHLVKPVDLDALQTLLADPQR